MRGAAIGQAGFAYPSPLAHQLAVPVMLWRGFVVALGLFAPLPIPPLAVPALAIVLAAALSREKTHAASASRGRISWARETGPLGHHPCAADRVLQHPGSDHPALALERDRQPGEDQKKESMVYWIRNFRGRLVNTSLRPDDVPAAPGNLAGSRCCKALSLTLHKDHGRRLTQNAASRNQLEVALVSRSSRRLELFSEAVPVIDGSKFKAVNGRDRNYTQAKLKRRLEQIDESIACYLSQLDSADREESTTGEAKRVRLDEKIKRLKAEIKRLKGIEHELRQTPDQQISETDPDAPSMATSGRGSGMVGYNAQIAVEPKHHLIVVEEATNVGNDRGQLAIMAGKVREAMGEDKLTAVADRGCYKGEEILAREQAGITTYLPKPQTSGNQAKGLFRREDFRDLPEGNVYRCPASERLIWRFRSVDSGKTLDSYWSSACPGCAMRKRCTTGKCRRIKRWEHEAVLQAARASSPCFRAG